MATAPKITYRVAREEFVKCEECKAWAAPGECKRRAPAMICTSVDDKQWQTGFWPLTDSTDGCFEGIPKDGE